VAERNFTMRRTFMIKPEEDGLGLLDVLVARGGGARRAAKRLLDERQVFVNGRRIWMAKHRMNAGDRVELPPTAGPVAADAGPRARTRPAEPDLPPPLYEDDEYLVLNKPAGWLSNDDPDSIETWLNRRRPGEDWRAVHRLDRDTSGCLWFARTEEARAAAVERFRAMEVRKRYDAIVIGRFPERLRRIDTPLDGQPAETKIAISAAAESASRLRIELVTGRTHQIRRHLLEAGFPLAGDRQYVDRRPLPPALRTLPRQMLHAAELRSPHPRRPDTVLQARAPLPADFRAALRALGLAAPDGRGKNSLGIRLTNPSGGCETDHAEAKKGASLRAQHRDKRVSETGGVCTQRKGVP
jgi:23S rRNA pseudouridine1911/1915/1917 synthase